MKITAEMLGGGATDADARYMVSLLMAREYDVEYTPDCGLVNGISVDDDIPDDVWSECLHIVSRREQTS